MFIQEIRDHSQYDGDLRFAQYFVLERHQLPQSGHRRERSSESSSTVEVFPAGMLTDVFVAVEWQDKARG